MTELPQDPSGLRRQLRAHQAEARWLRRATGALLLAHAVGWGTLVWTQQAAWYHFP